MCREAKPEAAHFAAAVLRFLPLRAGQDRVQEEKQGDNTFITTQMLASPEPDAGASGRRRSSVAGGSLPSSVNSGC
eukprot:3015796-Rhodomonas_salina.2